MPSKYTDFADCIARRENLSDNDILSLISPQFFTTLASKKQKKKYNSSSGHYQEIEGPAIALELLSEINNYKKRPLTESAFLIGNHHSYQKIDGLDFSNFG